MHGGIELEDGIWGNVLILAGGLRYSRFPDNAPGFLTARYHLLSLLCQDQKVGDGIVLKDGLVERLALELNCPELRGKLELLAASLETSRASDWSKEVRDTIDKMARFGLEIQPTVLPEREKRESA